MQVAGGMYAPRINYGCPFSINPSRHPALLHVRRHPCSPVQPGDWRDVLHHLQRRHFLSWRQRLGAQPSLPALPRRLQHHWHGRKQLHW